MKSKYRKGQYVLCKFKGNNGDLIAGRVESVRWNGKIILTNLLTDSPSTKDASVLDARNTVVPARIVKDHLKSMRQMDFKSARKHALELLNTWYNGSKKHKKEQLQLSFEKPVKPSKQPKVSSSSKTPTGKAAWVLARLKAVMEAFAKLSVTERSEVMEKASVVLLRFKP